MNHSLLEKFTKLGQEKDFKLIISDDFEINYEPLTNDALFHIPLIAISVLVLVKTSKTKVSTGELGRLVGVIFEETMPGFKGSPQDLGWSATLRHRTADAIVFLEQIKLVEVNSARHVTISERGNTFTLQLKRENSELGQAVRGFFRNADDCFKKVLNLL